MVDYHDVLNHLSVTELKKVIKEHISNVKFSIVKKKKEDLIKHIMEYTIYVKGQIKPKSKKVKQNDIFEEKESDSESDSDDDHIVTSDEDKEDKEDKEEVVEDDYKSYLSKLKISEIKDIVKALKNHFKINLVSKKKEELIDFISSHTKREDGVIKLNESDLNVVNGTKMSVEKQHLYIFKLKGRITRLQNELDDVKLYNKNPKNKDKKDTKKLQKEIDNIQKEIKVRAKKMKEDKDKEEGNKKVKKEEVVILEDLDFNKLRLLLFGQSGKLTRLNKELEVTKDKKLINKQIDEVKKYIGEIKEEMKKKKDTKPEPESESEEEEEEVKDDLDSKYLYIDNKIVTKSNNRNELKDYIKEHFKAPKKDKKGFFISFKEKAKDIIISVTRITITPKLFIGPNKDDMFIFVTVPKDKFKMDILPKIFKAFDKDLIDFSKDRIHIDDIYKLLKK